MKLNKKQQAVFDFIVTSLKKADISVTLCDDEDILREFSVPGKKDLLRFSPNDDEYGRTLKDAINGHGIVAPGLDTARVKIVDVSSPAKAGTGIKTAHAGEPGQFSYLLSPGALSGKMTSGPALRLSRLHGGSQAHMAAISHINEIIENSIDAEIHPDMEKISGRRQPMRIAGINRMAHRLYGAVSYNGEVYLAKTLIFEYRCDDNKPYTFEVDSVNVSPLRRIFARIFNAMPRISDNGYISGKDLLHGVKKAYDNKFLLDESRQVSKRMMKIFLNLPLRHRYLHKSKLYGWAKGNRIFITKEGINPYTPLHEYAHLWARAMRRKNPDGWRSITELLSGTDIWAKVSKEPPYKGKEPDDIAGEALARLSAHGNLQRIEQAARRVGPGVLDKTPTAEKIIRTVKSFWNWTADSLFSIPIFSSIEEVSDRILYDLCRGTKLDASEEETMSRAEIEASLAKRITAALKDVLENESQVPDSLLKSISSDGFLKTVTDKETLFQANLLLLASEQTTTIAQLRGRAADRLIRQKATVIGRHMDAAPLIFNIPPYTVTDIVFSNPPYKDGKPLSECDRWKDGTKDFGRILSISFTDGNDTPRRFGKNDIDEKNRVRFSLENADADIFYHLDTGAISWLPKKKKERGLTPGR